MTTHTTTNWTIDPAHSEVQFKVKHLAISNISGTFKTFKGTVQSNEEDFNGARIVFEVDVNSIYTNQEERDNHLRSPLFFDTEQFPVLRFEGVLHHDQGNYKLEGNLTIRDIQKKITLDAEHTGTGTGRFGDVRTGFEVNGKINRKDFGLTWSLLTDTGNLIVGEEIKLHFDIQLIQQTNN